MRQQVKEFHSDRAAEESRDFLRARIDAGLGWVAYPERRGGRGLPQHLQSEDGQLLEEAGAPPHGDLADLTAGETR